MARQTGQWVAIAALAAAALTAAPATSTPAPGLEADPLYPAGCFVGDRRDADVYEVELNVFPAARPKVDPGLGPQLARLFYPAACDAGNYARDRFRSRTTVNLHGDVKDGLCHSYDEWVERDPFLETRFTLFLNAYAPVTDMGGVLAGTAPAGAGALAWRAGPRDASGFSKVSMMRGGKPVEDAHDRWAALDEHGRPSEFLLCRKTGDVYNPGCEHHAVFDRARITLSYARAHIGRLREIEAFGRRMLRCALNGPLPAPRHDG